MTTTIMDLAASTGSELGVDAAVHPLIAGNEISIEKVIQNGLEAADTPVLDAAGNEIATISTFGDSNTATIKFSDGKGATLQRKSHYSELSGSSTEFGDIEIKTSWGNELQLTDKDGNSIVSFTPISRPWLWPFIILTACLGAACSCCFYRGPFWHLNRGNTRVGEVYKRYACDCCNDAKPPKGSWIQVKSEDPAALRASVLLISVELITPPSA